MNATCPGPYRTPPAASRKAWPIAVALAWLVVLPARAQEAPAEVSVAASAEVDPAAATPTAESVIRAAAEKLRSPGIPRPCVPSESGVIVVCAQQSQDGEVPSSSEEAAAEAARAARTPCDGCVQQAGSGVRIGFGRPPPEVLMIDLKAIPEAPPGSDAARFADDAGESGNASAAP